MPKFRCVPALFNRRGIDFSRAVRGIRRLPHQNEHHQFAFGGSAGLHALREESHDIWTHACIFVGMLSSAVRR
jgi:hypothetical protein